MIAVVVGRPHVVDLFDTGAFQRLDDAPEIAVAAVSGIDEQCLAGGGHEQRRLASLGIDVVDVEGLLTGRLADEAGSSRRKTQDYGNAGTHALISFWR